jgi:transposase-like protein
MLDHPARPATPRGPAGQLREVVRSVMQEMLEAEMMDVIGAEKGERTPVRLG